MSISKKCILCIVILSVFTCLSIAMQNESVFAAKKKIHLKKAKITLNVSGIDQFDQQRLIDKKGKTIKPTKVKWKSAKPSVAKINKKGELTAVNPGNTKMTAKYKGKTYKFAVKVTDYYDYNDDVLVRGYVGKAADCAYYVVDEVSGWEGDDYSSYSWYISELKKDFLDAANYLKKARAITSNRHERTCKTDCGFTTWDNMTSSLFDTCTSLHNTDVSNMSRTDKMLLSMTMLQTYISLENAYSEFGAWDFSKERL